MEQENKFKLTSSERNLLDSTELPPLENFANFSALQCAVWMNNLKMDEKYTACLLRVASITGKDILNMNKPSKGRWKFFIKEKLHNYSELEKMEDGIAAYYKLIKKGICIFLFI